MKTQHIIITLLLVAGFTSCVPQSLILRKIEETEKAVLSNSQKLTEIQTLIQRLDETYRKNQTILNSYEKEQIKARIDATDIDDVLNYLRSIVPTKKGNGN